MRRILVMVVMLLTSVALVGCSDDDDSSDSPTTGEDTDTTVAILDEDGEIDVDALNGALEDSILGDGGPVTDFGWQVTEASDDTVVMAPTTNAEDVTEQDADDVCGAVTTVVFRYLPTAIVSVTDGAGTVLVVSGPTGCAPPEA